MAEQRDKPLLAPGNEAKWARINEEEAAQDAADARQMSLVERLELGQRMIDHAFEFLNVMRASGHGPASDPRA